MRPTFLLCLFLLALTAPAHADPTGPAEDPDVAVLDLDDAHDREIDADRTEPDGLACAHHLFEIDPVSALDQPDALDALDLREPPTGYVYAMFDDDSSYTLDPIGEGDAV